MMASVIIIIIIIIIIINDSIYPAVSKASRTGNKVSCQPNDCPLYLSQKQNQIVHQQCVVQDNTGCAFW